MKFTHPGLLKRIEYKYDLISGKVNEVAYQPGNFDQFYHRYSYDAENKLTKVFTSPDRVVWEQEADYRYYRHGPLSRVELGQVGVQGVDYAYALQGWLKTVNSTAVTATTDMGGDGTLAGRKIAADVYGFALHYNSTDYKAINLSKTVVATVNSTALPAFKDLYNGNIAAMAVTFSHTSFGAAGTGLNQPLLYKYRYDQLNRFKEMDAYSGLNQTTNAWAFTTPLTAYQERVSYDGNGNILTYTRNGDAARTAMDNMTYSYVSGKNQLDKVVDVAADVTPANYPNYNDLKTGQATGNYDYDAIGNLIKDQSEGITLGGIVWNVYGKIASVTKGGVTTSYTYDASGNRISKTTGSKTTWYVRDASGNVMAVYESGNAAVNGGNLSQIEVHLYGSSRLGMWTPNRNVQVIPSVQTTTMTGVTNGVGVTRTFKRGQKFFELSNHLGNVLVTVTDRKVAIQNGTTGTILNYVADVVSGGDYYPFGMQMPGRNYSSDKYRFGFNGKEKDKDINSLTAYDYGFRIYNPAIGKFLSVDPLMKDYPSWSPYPFAMNRPIQGIDLDGLEFFETIVFRVVRSVLIKNKFYRDIELGFQERAETMVGGIFSLFSGERKGNADPMDTYGGPFGSSTIADPGKVRDHVKMGNQLFSMFEHVITDYLDLLYKASQGDGKAVGGLLFEAFLFYLPETKILEGASSLKYFRAATKAVANGARDFKALGEIALPARKLLGEVDDIERVLGAIEKGDLPGSGGAFIGKKRISEAEMRALSDKHGVEFALVYTAGKGKNGGSGFYTLYSGTKSSVEVPLGANEFLINHTHPGGTASPSTLDIRYLENATMQGSPQRSSVILPKNKPSVRFNKNTPTSGNE